MQIHLISGLPRAGSTVLASLLSQNPNIKAGISSPVLDYVTTLQERFSPANDASILTTDAQKFKMLLGIFDGYYHAVEPPAVIFDTNRFWTGHTDLIFHLFPDAKIIAMVRSLEWIFDSIERLIAKNPLTPSKLVAPHGTVYNRVKNLMAEYSMVGASLTGLTQAMNKCPEKIMLIDYDRLCLEPIYCLQEVYDFTGMQWCPFHDITALNSIPGAEKLDAVLATPGLHNVRRSVGYQRRESILPQDLIASLAQQEFWRIPGLYKTGVRSLLS